MNKSEIKLVDKFDEPVPQKSMDTSMDRLETTLGFVLDTRPDWTEFVTKNYKNLAVRLGSTTNKTRKIRRN